MGRLSCPDLVGNACIKRLSIDEVHDAYLSSSLEDCRKSNNNNNNKKNNNNNDDDSYKQTDVTINSEELIYLNTTILQ